MIAFTANAEESVKTLPDSTPPLVVEGIKEYDVFGWGQSVVVRGTIKQGVMAFGGDVVVEGVVE
ncbi:MAG: hypothetical protein DMF68_06305, partial [Acidobacteria bacterium]